MRGATGLGHAAPRIVAGIDRSFFLGDADAHLAPLMGYAEAHFSAHEIPKELPDGSRAPL
jgi:hypothetical protein